MSGGPSPTLADTFLSREWLDIFCTSPDIIQIEHKESKLIIAINKIKRVGFTIGTCPHFTPYNACIFHPEKEMNASVKYNLELGIYHKLLNHPLRYDGLQLKFPPQFLSLPRIDDKRIHAKIAFTELVDFPINITQHWNSLASEIRNDILFARNNSSIKEIEFDAKVAQFLLSNKYYSNSGLNEADLTKAFQSFSKLGVIKFFAVMLMEKIKSCSVFVRSGNCWYYWLNFNQKGQNIRGMHLALMWEGIYLAASNNCSFNFDGSNKVELSKIFKSLGSNTVVFPNTYLFNHSLLRLVSKFKW